jgi:hypothetical protein
MEVVPEDPLPLLVPEPVEPKPPLVDGLMEPVVLPIALTEPVVLAVTLFTHWPSMQAPQQPASPVHGAPAAGQSPHTMFEHISPAQHPLPSGLQGIVSPAQHWAP